MELPTYTSIWRIEKRLYKLYDFRLPMPVPVGQIAIFAAITVPYIVLLTIFGLPFNHNLFWLYVLPPGLLTWLATRPVLESKRLPELIHSQARYLGEPRTWCRMKPLAENDEILVFGRVWRRAGTGSEILEPAAEQLAIAPVVAGQTRRPVAAPSAQRGEKPAELPAGRRARQVTGPGAPGSRTNAGYRAGRGAGGRVLSDRAGCGADRVPTGCQGPGAGSARARAGPGGAGGIPRGRLGTTAGRAQARARRSPGGVPGSRPGSGAGAADARPRRDAGGVPGGRGGVPGDCPGAGASPERAVHGCCQSGRAFAAEWRARAYGSGPGAWADRIPTGGRYRIPTGGRYRQADRIPVGYWIPGGQGHRAGRVPDGRPGRGADRIPGSPVAGTSPARAGRRRRSTSQPPRSCP